MTSDLEEQVIVWYIEFKASYLVRLILECQGARLLTEVVAVKPLTDCPISRTNRITN